MPQHSAVGLSQHVVPLRQQLLLQQALEPGMPQQLPDPQSHSQRLVLVFQV